MESNYALKQCTIVLTRNCNLRCFFCYVKEAGYDPNDQISYDDLQRIVNFCCEANTKFIFFTGGEPLTYPHIMDILQYIKSQKPSIVTAIATNGILLEDPEFCRKLIDSGLGYIDISMKGSDTEGWKKATGFDGANKQLQAIRNLSALSMEFTCSMVITPENVKTFCNAVRTAHDNGAKQFSFTFVIDNNDSEEKNLAYLEKCNPFKLISNFVAQIDCLNSITDDWWIEYSFPMCAYTEEQLQLLDGRLSTPCQIHLRNAITVNTKLDLLPCDMYVDQKLGKLGTDFVTFEDFTSFSEDITAAYHNVIENIRKYPSKECSKCEYLEACYGGCPVLWKNYSFESFKNYKKAFLQG